MTPTPLPFRDALHDDDNVASILNYQGKAVSDPVITIAIPTFNRPELIRETLASALAQANAPSLEILIIDNASDPENIRELTKYLQSLGDVPIRYYVNNSNIGMFGNWNRCISLARGYWITVLSDDDLLLPHHLSTIFAEISRIGDNYASYTCSYTFLDQRSNKPRSPILTNAIMKLKKFIRFAGKYSVDLGLRRMFWANLAGSSLGAVFPRQLAIDIGGFYPEDFPSADYYFHARVAMKARLLQVSGDLVLMRLQVNETMKRLTLLGFIVANHRLRLGLAASKAVPADWAKISPVLIGYERRASSRFTGIKLSKAEVANATGEQERYVPSPLVWIWRMLSGGV